MKSLLNRLKDKLSTGKFSWLIELGNSYCWGNTFAIDRKKNKVVLSSAVLRNSSLIITGNRNEIIIEKQTRLHRCRIYMRGNNNKISIGIACTLYDLEIWLEDDGNSVIIGNGTTVNGATQLAAIEGTSIIIGDDCMFSTDVFLRTGDSHSIIDMAGQRINPSSDINIGDHVWVGQKVLIMKGSHISANSIIAAGALVTDQFDETNVIVGGLPAKVIKRDIGWLRERI